MPEKSGLPLPILPLKSMATKAGPSGQAMLPPIATWTTTPSHLISSPFLPIFKGTSMHKYQRPKPGKGNRTLRSVTRSMASLALLATLALPSIPLDPTSARAEPPQGTDLDSPIHKWFEKQHNAKGVLCCDRSDGHELDDNEWTTTPTGEYKVLIQGIWYTIQPYQLVDPHGGPNPTSHAIVWYLLINKIPIIFCFTPGYLG